jgi:DtxR family Mn-dependent transcriptional regulator
MRLREVLFFRGFFVILNNMTQSMEDYLEMVSFLADEGVVRLTDIATRLGFTKSSVHSALKVLSERGLVEHKRYSPVSLTSKGLALALEIRERHNLIKNFLIHTLGVASETAERDACKMEHILSEETLDKIREKSEGNRPLTEKLFPQF